MIDELRALARNLSNPKDRDLILLVIKNLTNHNCRFRHTWGKWVTHEVSMKLVDNTTGETANNFMEYHQLRKCAHCGLERIRKRN